jgi:hypothetical protein
VTSVGKQTVAEAATTRGAPLELYADPASEEEEEEEEMEAINKNVQKRQERLNSLDEGMADIKRYVVFIQLFVTCMLFSIVAASVSLSPPSRRQN